MPHLPINAPERGLPIIPSAGGCVTAGHKEMQAERGRCLKFKSQISQTQKH